MRVLSVLVFLLVGCSGANKVKLSRVSENESLFFGRFLVNFNGKTNKDLKCEIYINSEFRPTMDLPEDGIVAFKSLSSKLVFNQIACYDKKTSQNSYWHYYTLNIAPLKGVNNSKVFSYIGDVVIDWDTSKSGKARSFASEISPADDTHRNNKKYNQGLFSLALRNNYTATKNELLAHYGKDIEGEYRFHNALAYQQSKRKKIRKSRKSRRR